MRVAFDGRTLGSPAAGVRRYATQLFRAIAADPGIEVLALGGAPAVMPAGVHAAAGARSLPTNLGWAVSGLPAAIARAGLDVFHAPAYTAPLRGRVPLVLTVHDISYARHPEWSPHRVGPARQWFYRTSARRADRLITDSTFSRSELEALYGIPAERIHVIPLGVAPELRGGDDGPREPIVLHVGDLHRRRNLGVLVDAVLELRRAPDTARARLVLVGTDRGELDALQARARAAGAPDALSHEAAASDRELADWYGRAAVLAYPSLYEGFGLPLIEAMACGAPVVAARAGASPEVVGTAGWLVDPGDVRAWRDALTMILCDPERAGDLAARGRRHAAGFTWARTAAATVAVYREALGAARPGRPRD